MKKVGITVAAAVCVVLLCVGFYFMKNTVAVLDNTLFDDHPAIIAERICSCRKQTVCLCDVVASVLYCHTAVAADIVI